ncbi:hypothetical protein ACVWXN_008012 [Bradyrhizobium sp. i1.4.4]
MHPFNLAKVAILLSTVFLMANSSEIRAEKDPVCIASCGGQYFKDSGNCPTSSGDVLGWTKCTEQAEKDRQKCEANCKDLPKPTPTPTPTPTPKPTPTKK